MKKFAKISLAAAVAVAGLSSVASAKPLEEAIKGVDATGYVTYQYNDEKSQLPGGQSTQKNNYKAALALTIPAADDVAIKLVGVANSGVDSLNDGTGDVNPTTDLTDATFVYSGVQNLTVMAGKQALNTPWTEGSSVINATQTGTGALALYNAGFATLAAGHFVNNNVNGSQNGAFTSPVSSLLDTATTGAIKNRTIDISAQDISVVAAIVPIADVATAQVWHAQIGGRTGETFNEGLKVWSYNVNANLMDLAKLDVRHSTLKGDNGSVEKQKLTKATLSGSIAMVNLAAAYAKTGKEGGIVAFDKDADAAFTGYQLSLNGIPDAKAYLLNANMNVLPSVNVGLTHIDGDTSVANGLGLDFEETYAQVTYNHNKNLSAYVRYGNAEYTRKITGAKAVDNDAGRLQIGYKF